MIGSSEYLKREASNLSRLAGGVRKQIVGLGEQLTADEKQVLNQAAAILEVCSGEKRSKSRARAMEEQEYQMRRQREEQENAKYASQVLGELGDGPELVAEAERYRAWLDQLSREIVGKPFDDYPFDHALEQAREWNDSSSFRNLRDRVGEWARRGAHCRDTAQRRTPEDYRRWRATLETAA